MNRIVLVWAFLLILGPSLAMAAGNEPTPITQCETISTSGNYYLASNISDFSPNPTPVCLVIAAPRVTINMNGYSIGTPEPILNAGIEIKPGAGRTVILGGGGAIAGFVSPLLVEANRAIITDLDARGNGAYHGITVLGLGSLNNTSLINVSLSSGFLFISGGTDNYVTGMTVGSMFIDNSNGNIVSDNYVTGEIGGTLGYGSGIVLGAGADSNLLSGNTVIPAGYTGGSIFGILISPGATHNRIEGNTVTGWTNPPLSNGVDLEDQNPGCDHDLWTNNTFDTANPSSCIQ